MRLPAGAADDSRRSAHARQRQLVAALNYLGYLAGSFDAMRSARGVAAAAGRLGCRRADVAVRLYQRAVAACGGAFPDRRRQRLGNGAGGSMEHEQLLHHGRPGLSAAVFAGPGTGIFISGMLAVLLHASGVSAAFARRRTVCWRCC